MSHSSNASRGCRSSDWHSRIPTINTPLDASAPDFAPPVPPAQALAALLSLGHVRINMTAEREDAAATPDHPGFLMGVHYHSVGERNWYEKVLPYLAECTFVVASTTDVTYSGKVFGSASLPHIYNAVTKVELPKFYWFSGVALNRHTNPYMQMCQNLPNLRELSFTIHFAGLTNQRWPERQIVALEQNNPEVSKERILLPLKDVVHRYELDVVFACGALRRLRLDYIESDMTTYFCKVGNPLDMLGRLKAYIDKGFAQRGMQVSVELVRVGEEGLDGPEISPDPSGI